MTVGVLTASWIPPGYELPNYPKTPMVVMVAGKN